MKNSFLLVILAIAVSFFSCKKSGDDAPAPVINPGQARIKTISYLDSNDIVKAVNIYTYD